MSNTLLIAIIVLGLLLIGSILIGLISLARTQATSNKMAANTAKMDSYFTAYGELVANNQRAMSEQQDKRLKALEESLYNLRSENYKQLESMRETVDEKLQSTLDEKFSQSFGLVNERLEQVYKGLGEMQTVASGVGDLKKILSNVKTRGILGEVQLAAILEQILNRDQYEENVATVRGSSNRVEFAVKLPGDGSDIVYLPIDSKFPGETYNYLMDAYESADKDAIAKCKTALKIRLKAEAKDIKEKYISVPDTTDFGIMFLPFEGLYAEAVNMGMVEELQRSYKVTIAGPTTMAALLNSLQMGFNTLAIEKKSSEVWKILSEVKKEFENFDDALKAARNRIRQADAELEKLEGVRTRAINRKLRDVILLDEEKDEDIRNSRLTSGL